MILHHENVQAITQLTSKLSELSSSNGEFIIVQDSHKFNSKTA